MYRCVVLTFNRFFDRVSKDISVVNFYLRVLEFVIFAGSTHDCMTHSKYTGVRVLPRLIVIEARNSKLRRISNLTDL